MLKDEIFIFTTIQSTQINKPGGPGFPSLCVYVYVCMYIKMNLSINSQYVTDSIIDTRAHPFPNIRKKSDDCSLLLDAITFGNNHLSHCIDLSVSLTAVTQAAVSRRGDTEKAIKVESTAQRSRRPRG